MRILAVLVLIILVLFGLYFFMPDLFGGFTNVGTSTVSTSTQATTRNYASSTTGLSFQYPASYTLREMSASSTGGSGVIISMADTAALAQAPVNGEGPPSMNVAIFTTSATSAERWIRTDQRSNFGLAGTSTLASTSIDNIQAFEYESDGLYATRNVVLLHEGRIYIFSAGWIARTDKIVSDFSQLLRTVNLQ